MFTAPDCAASMDADQECRHGRMPTDPTAPCGCYPASLEHAGDRLRQRRAFERTLSPNAPLIGLPAHAPVTVPERIAA